MLKGLSRPEGEAVMKSRGAISITIFALLLAVFTLISNSNSSKILTATLTINDTWNFYQAKSIKQNIYELRVEPDEKMITRYEEEKKDLMAKARVYELDRDEAKKKSPWYAMAMAIMQIAIVLSSASILAVSMEMFLSSIAAGVFSTLLFLIGYF